VGHSYVLQSQQGNDLGIRAVATNQVDLDLAELTDHQAQLAGFENRGEAFQWFRERRERIPAPASRDEPPKGTYHVTLTLYAIDRTHHPRLLGKTGGYVEQRAIALQGVDVNDPGEAVDAATQREFSKRGRERFASPHAQRERQQERERQTLERRLADARYRARMSGVDITTDERVIEERIRRIERKTIRDEAA
jgi:hypothetical protein